MPRAHHICALFLLVVLALLVAVIGVPGRAEAAQASRDTADNFLYKLGLEYRRIGQLEEAAHELRKALLINPDHPNAARELKDIEALLHGRERAMSEAVAAALMRHASERLPAEAVSEPAPPELTRLRPEVVEQLRGWFRRGRALGLPTRRVAPPSPLAVRVPDPRVNGVKWFYVFGHRGDPDDGALPDITGLSVSVPREGGSPVRLRVIDADTRGRHDELKGDWDTSTAFRVLGRSTVLDATIIGPSSPDGTAADFGPFAPEQGEPQGEQALFRLEAEGLGGDDNNLFAVEVSPASAQCFSYNPSVRLPEETGAAMRFFPGVPERATVLTEANYDFDADGGRAWLIPSTPGGRPGRAVPLASSGSGAWSTTVVDVPEGTDGTRWTYRVTKGTQRKGNMAFRLSDQRGAPVPIYATPERMPPLPAGPRAAAHPRRKPGQAGDRPRKWRAAGHPAAARWSSAKGRVAVVAQPMTSAVTPQPVASARRRSCNTFSFDASASSDPDRDPLTYHWDFGDGATAEGISVSHTYAASGEYRVALEVTDSTGQACGSGRTEQVVHVDSPPAAAIEAPSMACVGAVTRFSAATSSGSPGAPLTYRWDFGDGTTAEGQNVTHVYARGGSYLAQLTVDDGRGTVCSTDAATAVLHVNSPPTAKAIAPVTMCASSSIEPLSVTLNAVGSSDADFDPLAYRWDFGDGATGEGLRVSHVYRRGGAYTATVTVDDGAGSACSTTTAVVPVRVNHPPLALVANPAMEGCPGDTLTFDASRSVDADGDALTYHWDFGDGHGAEGAVARHEYPGGGRFSARLTVDDGAGMACSLSTAAVTADINAPPVAHFVIRSEASTPSDSP